MKQNKRDIEIMLKWFETVSQRAERLGVTPQAVRKAIKENRLTSFRLGNQWVIEIDEVNKR